MDRLQSATKIDILEQQKGCLWFKLHCFSSGVTEKIRYPKRGLGFILHHGLRSGRDWLINISRKSASDRRFLYYDLRDFIQKTVSDHRNTSYDWSENMGPNSVFFIVK